MQYIFRLKFVNTCDSTKLNVLKWNDFFIICKQSFGINCVGTRKNNFSFTFSIMSFFSFMIKKKHTFLSTGGYLLHSFEKWFKNIWYVTHVYVYVCNWRFFQNMHFNKIWISYMTHRRTFDHVNMMFVLVMYVHVN